MIGKSTADSLSRRRRVECGDVTAYGGSR